MGAQHSVFPESLDEILSVVNETPRGRWFLEAYANRLQNQGTSSILTAIAKLESNLQSMTAGGADATVLAGARQAIAAARQEIARMESGNNELSVEGQLFAKLAELSRNAFSEKSAVQPALGKSVERALRLVADLDRDLNEPIMLKAPIASKPSVQYFKQDEHIFEPAPVATPNKPQIKLEETTPKGAKLVVQRMTAPAIGSIEPIPPLVEATKAKMIEPPVFATVAAETPPEQNETSRITIIRRKIDEVVAVPLLEDGELETVSAA